ncbi:hypothetical protein [Algirhabdus cladophorae]
MSTAWLSIVALVCPELADFWDIKVALSFNKEGPTGMAGPSLDF